MGYGLGASGCDVGEDRKCEYRNGTREGERGAEDLAEPVRGAGEPAKQCRPGERHGDLRGHTNDHDVTVAQVVEPGAREEAFGHLLDHERPDLNEGESRGEGSETLGGGRLRTAPGRPEHHGGDAGEEEHQRHLSEDGEVVVAGPLEQEVAVVRIGYGDRVRQGVTQDQAGNGEAGHRQAAEPVRLGDLALFPPRTTLSQSALSFGGTR